MCANERTSGRALDRRRAAMICAVAIVALQGRATGGLGRRGLACLAQTYMRTRTGTGVGEGEADEEAD